MNNEYMFLFKFDSLEDRRTVTAKGVEYIVAKESLSELLNLIMEKGNEEEQERARNVDSHIACYVPDNIFKTVSDEELLQYVNEHIYDGELLEPEPDRNGISFLVFVELRNATEENLAMQITDHIIDGVIEDLKETSNFPEFNDSDIRLAIGRVLVNALEKLEQPDQTEKPKVPKRIIRFA